jgi:hypothetical protein
VTGLSLALAETTERTVRFDIERIVRDEIQELEIAEITAPKEHHYTEITLENLHHVPVGRTIGMLMARRP